MNERIGNSKIYALAKEAGLIEFEQFAWNPELGSPTYESVAKARKFAELIVKECCHIMNTTAKKAEESNTYMGDDVPTRVHQYTIKQHFGVEE